MIIPNIPRILLKTRIGKIARKSCRIILIRIQPKNMKTFRSHFRSFILVSPAVLCSPDTVFRIRVVCPDRNLTAFRYFLFITFNMNRSYHRLTCISESPGRTMIKHIPLPVYLFYTAMGVMSAIRSLQFRTIAV